MLAALEAVLENNTRANRIELMRAWDAGMSWFEAPEGVTFKGGAGRIHATVLLKRLRSWEKVGRRLGDLERGATHGCVVGFAGKYFGQGLVSDLKVLDEECKRLCVAPRPNPGEGKCESCADVNEFVETVIGDAEDELKAALERKGAKKRRRKPSTDEVVVEVAELLRVAADKELAKAYGDDGKKYKRGEGPLDKDHVKYWAIFRVLASVQQHCVLIAPFPRSGTSFYPTQCWCCKWCNRHFTWIWDTFPDARKVLRDAVLTGVETNHRDNVTVTA